MVKKRRLLKYNWEERRDEVVAIAKAAHDRLRARDPNHELLPYMTTPDGNMFAIQQLCDRFYPDDMQDWQTIVVGAAVVVSLEAYTQALEAALAE